VSFSETGKAGEMVIKQTQEMTDVTGYRKGLYKMPVWIEIHYTDGSADKQLCLVEQQTEIVRIPMTGNKKIDYVLFDPNNEILKSISFTKPFSMLQSQALHAADMLDRYDAVAAMRKTDIEKKREALISVYKQENFYAIKTEVIAQLANDNNTQSISLIKEALADKDAAVRKAVLKSVSPFMEGLLSGFENLLSDSSYDIVETALTKLSAAFPSNTKSYLDKCKGVEGNIGKNVKTRWLEIYYSAFGKKQYADELVSLTGNSYEFRTRANAMAALKRCSYFGEALTENLVDALLSPNERLSNPAKDLLKFFYSQDKYRKTISSYVASQQWLDWQRTLLSANDF
jgi:hypothetical protein